MTAIRTCAAIALATLAWVGDARAQGLPGGYAPERGVRLPSRLPDAEDGVLDKEDDGSRRYREGMLIPPGFEVVSTYYTPLLGSGTAIFAFHWVLSVVLAGADLRLGRENAVRSETRNDALMAPLIGPFIALGTEDDRPSAELALFALDGIAQVASLSMAMSGLLLRQKWVVRVQPSGVAIGTRF